MKKLIFGIISALVLSSCGGSSGGGKEFLIEGTWKGDLYQGVIFCADGTTISACGGCVVETIALIVDGSDVIGSPVSARNKDCLFRGSRTADGFEAEAVSGCEKGLVRLEFNLLEDGSAGVAFSYDIDQIPVEPGQTACKISPSGTLTK